MPWCRPRAGHQLPAVGDVPGLDGRHRRLRRFGRAFGKRKAGAQASARQELGGRLDRHGRACWCSVLCGCTSLTCTCRLTAPACTRASCGNWASPALAAVVFLAAMSVVGDLFESLVKRSCRCQGQQPVCCPAMAACSIASTRWMPVFPSLWRWPASPAPPLIPLNSPCRNASDATRLRAGLHRLHRRQHAGRDRPPPRSLRVVALTATSVDALAAQCLTWRPRFAVMPDRTPQPRWPLAAWAVGDRGAGRRRRYEIDVAASPRWTR